MRKTLKYHLHDVTDYISWSYFFYAWGIPSKFATLTELDGCPTCRQGWVASFPEADREQARTAIQLYDEALALIRELDGKYFTYAHFAILPVEAEDDNLYVEGGCIPLLRQQVKKDDSLPHLCLADFVRPRGSAYPTLTQEGKPTVGGNVGLFCTSIDGEMEHLYDDDPYKRMLVQTVCDRLSEATAERMHEDVRRIYWGYAPDEQLELKDIILENYQGIRPAVGYPSLPDQSIIFVLDSLLDLSQIGIQITESGAMMPHASVCGLMFAHPESRYFVIGAIDEGQLADYAQRRGTTPDALRKFLSANLKG